jgi:hypothetical protein
MITNVDKHWIKWHHLALVVGIHISAVIQYGVYSKVKNGNTV